MSEERVIRTRKPVKCPRCGFSPVGSILYGYPFFSEKLQAELQSGKTVLGGCELPLNDSLECIGPCWECSKCGCQIYRRR